MLDGTFLRTLDVRLIRYCFEKEKYCLDTVRSTNEVNMECTAVIPDVSIISQPVLIGFRVANSLIALLNIFANILLMFALKRTGQTETISFQLIFIMSASDLTTGLTAVSLTNLLTLDEFNANCSIKKAAQFIQVAFGGFSFFTVFLIALDRFLHMKYLQQYPRIMTKTKGYLLIIISFSFHFISAIILTMPFSRETMELLQLVYFVVAFPVVVTVVILYYKSCKTAKLKLSSIKINRTQKSLMQSRKLSKAAMWTTVCLGIQTTPLIASHVILALNRWYGIMKPVTMATFKWVCYIGALGNGLGSSLIFIQYNKPVKQLLWSMMERRPNRVSIDRTEKCSVCGMKNF